MYRSKDELAYDYREGSWLEIYLEAGEYMTIQDVLAAASQLSQEERLQVAIRLLESLRDSYSAQQQKLELDPSWQADLHPLVQNLIEVTSADDAQASNIDHLEESCSLHDLLSQSPLSQLDFEAEPLRSPVRAVEF